MFNRLLRFIVLSVALAELTIVMPALAEPPAQEQAPVFVEPPTAEELAGLLFGPRYRSIDATPTGKRFGMLINFKLDSVQVLPQSLPLLESVGEMLSLRDGAREVLVIEGHADARGTSQHNLNLSARRADAIKRYLVKSFDVAPERLVTIGKGESEPHDATNGEAPVNRRVEFRAVSSIVIN